MDIRITLDVTDWECQEDIRWNISEMIHDLGIDREMISFDTDVFILDSTEDEMEMLSDWATAYLGG